MAARSGMELTEVPPSIAPTLKVVRGSLDTRTLTKRASPRESAWIGFGTPKSDQLWPPGPSTLISTRREATAAAVTWSVEEIGRASCRERVRRQETAE